MSADSQSVVLSVCLWTPCLSRPHTTPLKNARAEGWWTPASLQFLTSQTMRGMGTSVRRNDSWDRLGGQALLMIG